MHPLLGLIGARGLHVRLTASARTPDALGEQESDVEKHNAQNRPGATQNYERRQAAVLRFQPLIGADDRVVVVGLDCPVLAIQIETAA